MLLISKFLEKSNKVFKSKLNFILKKKKNF